MDGMNVARTTASARSTTSIRPLDAAIYYKGAWVLHMLRHVIGDAAFFDGIRAYTERPGPQLRRQRHRGPAARLRGDLGHGPGLVLRRVDLPPRLPEATVADLEHARPSASAATTSPSTSQQIQTVGPIFKMPIDIRIDTSVDREYFVVWDSLRTQSFTLHVEGTPTNVVIDADNWLIKTIVSGSGRGGERTAARSPEHGKLAQSVARIEHDRIPAPAERARPAHDLRRSGTRRSDAPRFAPRAGRSPRALGWPGRGREAASVRRILPAPRSRRGIRVGTHGSDPMRVLIR